MIFKLFHNLIHKIYCLNIKTLIKLNNSKYSKAFILHKLIELNNKSLNDLNYRIPITFEINKQAIFHLNGIQIIHSNLHRKHIKNYDNKIHNEAFKFLKYFNNDKKKTIIDLGANEGEISIFFAKKINCKVFAIECAEKNLYFLNKNIELNNVENIQVFKYAIYDKDDLNLTVNFKSNETQVHKKNEFITNNENELVESITLSTFIKSQNINFIDFLKIDIENSNYLVSNCILKNYRIIKSILWEIGFYNSENFKLLILKLCKMFDFYLLKNNDLVKISVDDVLLKIQKEVNESSSGFDLFMFNKDHYNYDKEGIVI